MLITFHAADNERRERVQTEAGSPKLIRAQLVGDFSKGYVAVSMSPQLVPPVHA